MKAPSLIAILLSVALLAAGCGDDDDGESSSAGNVQRYCQLSQQLDRAGTVFFAKLEEQGGSAKEFEAAERQFYLKYEDDFDEIKAVAPEAVREDLDTLFASLRARAGLGAPVPQAEASAAERRVQAYEKANC